MLHAGDVGDPLKNAFTTLIAKPQTTFVHGSRTTALNVAPKAVQLAMAA